MCKDICKLLASALCFCTLICLKPFRIARKNSYVKIISIVYRDLAEKIRKNRRYCSAAFENYSSASECRWTIIPSLGMPLNNYLAAFRMFSDKLECKKGALKQVNCKYLCTNVFINTLNHPRTYNFSRSFFLYQIQPISIAWDASFKSGSYVKYVQYPYWIIFGSVSNFFIPII